MHGALEILSELDYRQKEWIFKTGLNQRVHANTPIIKEGTKLEALYFIMEGLVGIYVPSAGENRIASLGPGEILGDISF